VESKAFAVFLLYLELLQSPLEAGKVKTFIPKKQGKGEKQILFGQRVLETGKWIL
jgi:hypothetical protein